MLRHLRNVHGTPPPQDMYMTSPPPQPPPHDAYRTSPPPPHDAYMTSPPPPHDLYMTSPPPHDAYMTSPPPPPPHEAYMTSTTPQFNDTNTSLDNVGSTLLPMEPYSSIVIVGPTSSGKTRWTYRLLNCLNRMYAGVPPDKVLYCYGVYQTLYDTFEDTMPHVTLHQGLPSLSEIENFADGQHGLVIIDDLMQQVLGSDDMKLLFTQTCHHKRISVIFISQNLYGQGKSARTIALNCWYIILFKNLRGTSQIATLGRQLFPGKSDILLESFQASTSVPFGYLMIDMSQRGRDEYRLRTKVFPGEDTIIYKPKRL